MRNEPEAIPSRSEPSLHPRGFFDPYFRQGTRRRAIIALIALPLLLAALLYVVLAFNPIGATCCAILLAGMALVAIRELNVWWQLRFCSHCRYLLNEAWCWKCDRMDLKALLREPVGSLNPEIYNRHEDAYAKLLSLVLTIAVRDHAQAFRIEGLTKETQFWSLHDEEWVEWMPAPEGVGKPLVNVVHALAGLPQSQAGSQAGSLTVIDPTKKVHQCQFATEIGPDVSRVELKFEGVTQATTAGGC